MEESKGMACAGGPGGGKEGEGPEPRLVVEGDVQLFRCTFCDRSFNKKANCKIHMRKHTGELPYTCSAPGCEKRFMWKSSITFHELNAHPNGSGDPSFVGRGAAKEAAPPRMPQPNGRMGGRDARTAKRKTGMKDSAMTKIAKKHKLTAPQPSFCKPALEPKLNVDQGERSGRDPAQSSTAETFLSLPGMDDRFLIGGQNLNDDADTSFSRLPSASAAQSLVRRGFDLSSGSSSRQNSSLPPRPSDPGANLTGGNVHGRRAPIRKQLDSYDIDINLEPRKPPQVPYSGLIRLASQGSASSARYDFPLSDHSLTGLRERTSTWMATSPKTVGPLAGLGSFSPLTFSCSTAFSPSNMGTPPLVPTAVYDVNEISRSLRLFSPTERSRETAPPGPQTKNDLFSQPLWGLRTSPSVPRGGFQRFANADDVPTPGPEENRG
uniref:C2H2-type domain-containing protein n=1 Tax=Rhodosorus marinus TaxID=101924 RepID=A0A7S3A854_9RHOD|mmetsp:Transcript_5146/g.22189  ORF Transcript_5146/g.22189 Transcript_5146/m.22189 type:complete len:436 (+) Transcript_5146:515-1822(+)|eukprot:CAMPEP_0113961120 /NCGR_PEP_ID=MMETSP0011_2-20120614/5115_1 /TAXON_ID=101924 /ORGANISM="Rhodosorus marinus" /LENGTH=435 /DNA_ID=CAMNT_0000972691 /DNA_START=434 /DNA_END=1741 /DNA_ORIENTATION=- /assembly_acc=CAM_ASM_000156